MKEHRLARKDELKEGKGKDEERRREWLREEERSER